MTLLFALSLLLILYTYAGYPILIALAARFRPRPWLRKSWSDQLPPPISIVMAVHNGAALLRTKITQLLALDPNLIKEIIIISDGSTDQTNPILESECPIHHGPLAMSGVDPRLRSIFLPAQAGKCVALNHGIAAATGEILLFIDIRPTVNSAAIHALLENFADPSVGCVAGELLLTEDSHDPTAQAIGGLYWRYEQWIRNCEAAVDSPVGVYGGFYAIRRSTAVPAPPGLILDDMFQPLAIIRQGYRSVLDRTAFVTDRWPSKSSGEFSRKVRTLAGNFQLLQQAPWLLTRQNRVAFQLISHKLLRLLVPYAFITLFIASAFVSPIFAALQAAFWIMAAIAITRPIPVIQRIAAPASALLVLNAAAIVGLYKFLFTQGPLWRIWSPTATPNS